MIQEFQYDNSYIICIHDDQDQNRISLKDFADNLPFIRENDVLVYFDGFYNGIIVDTLNYLYKEKGDLFQDIKYIITYTFNKQRHYRSYKNWIDGYEAYIKMSGYRFYSNIQTNFNVHLFSEANAYNTELKNNTNHESNNINTDIDISLLD